MKHVCSSDTNIYRMCYISGSRPEGVEERRFHLGVLLYLKFASLKIPT